MSVIATIKGAKIAPRKASLVASLVRGRSVTDAIVILEHTPKKSALMIKKVIESAKANATNNHNLKEDGLYISEISVGPGPSYKRFTPAAFGRALPYKKRTSHIRVILEGIEKPKPTVKAVKTKKTDNKEIKNDVEKQSGKKEAK